MIIGLTGTYCGGKDTVADILEEKGFIHHSCSDILRDECRARNLELTRDNLIQMGKELRSDQGHGVLAERLMQKFKPMERYVISSIRHPEEVKALQRRKDFFLINVDAPIKLRLERIQARKRENDPQTLAELKAKEKQESATKGAGQQLGVVGKMAKIILLNDGTIAELKDKVDNLVADLNVKKIKLERPDKDQYYMDIAKNVAMRCTCLSIKFGAVILKEDQIVSTGYVGAPRKTSDCITRGFCLRRRLKVPSGERYELCRSVHAEMNAIINAARAGVSVLGGTVFLWGAKINEGEFKVLDMQPCFICKKMIINAGIKRFVVSTKEGGTRSFDVDEWTKDWTKKDMLDDMHKYSAGDYYKKNRNKQE